MELNREAALVLVDIQRDLLPSGLKAVPRGDEVVAAANRLAESFDEHGLRVVATRCWLPADHSSFASQGGGLSPYCLQDTHGAEFADDLQLPEAAWIESKGVSRERDVISPFAGTDLADRLREDGVRLLLICGLATDTTVRQTVIDALGDGFEVILVADACRGYNKHAADSARAVEDMLRAGARIASSGAVQNALEAYSAT
jgi:nicotinamidase/pyrazinamidase